MFMMEGISRSGNVGVVEWRGWDGMGLVLE